MVALLLLGVWVVIGPSVRYETRPGAQLSKFNLGSVKGELEVVAEPNGPGGGGHTFRFLFPGGASTRVLSAEEFRAWFGEEAYERVTRNAGSTLFRALNVTGWAGLIWVAAGFAGQGAFFGRMWIQWLASERSKRSVVPEAFWWLSLAGGVLLFAYFAWRQDIVGVVGQTSGVVIYARNIRLIHKQRRRAERDAARAAASGGVGDTTPELRPPSPEPGPPGRAGG
ncbi:MAG: lipid-A-disaccharide synthase N-terminal domain-containing protein [Phycisphaerae bacterium]|nr:lipid-A-disaccharide synthase N-terminal domain-containing protein [Phycisphaerae bacterium]